MYLIKIIYILKTKNKYEKIEILNEPKQKTKDNQIIKIISILFLLFIFYYFTEHFIKNNRILIEVDTSRAKLEGGGPVQIQKAISKVLPYQTKKCIFFPINRIYPINIRKEINFYFMTSPGMRESTFEKWKSYNRAQSLLLGPCFVPNRWFLFPMKNSWKERRFREVLLSIKGVVVHSERVRDHLAKSSNNTDLLNKFILMRPCTYFMPKIIKPFKERNIDIILY